MLSDRGRCLRSVVKRDAADPSDVTAFHASSDDVEEAAAAAICDSPNRSLHARDPRERLGQSARQGIAGPLFTSAITDLQKSQALGTDPTTLLLSAGCGRFGRILLSLLDEHLGPRSPETRNARIGGKDAGRIPAPIHSSTLGCACRA